VQAVVWEALSEQQADVDWGNKVKETNLEGMEVKVLPLTAVWWLHKVIE
jgi:hypothetical protein